jgi:hypothetical protein
MHCKLILSVPALLVANPSLGISTGGDRRWSPLLTFVHGRSPRSWLRKNEHGLIRRRSVAVKWLEEFVSPASGVDHESAPGLSAVSVEIIADHPELEREDIVACLHHARLLLSGEPVRHVA